MRLKPRNIKRLMFSCVQCGQCLTACDTSNTDRAKAPSLEWHIGLDAVRETLKQRHHDKG
jgi:Fe-S oxidoreductase